MGSSSGTPATTGPRTGTGWSRSATPSTRRTGGAGTPGPCWTNCCAGRPRSRTSGRYGPASAPTTWRRWPRSTGSASSRSASSGTTRTAWNTSTRCPYSSAPERAHPGRADLAERLRPRLHRLNQFGGGRRRPRDHVGRVAVRQLVLGELVLVEHLDPPVEAADHVQVEVDGVYQLAVADRAVGDVHVDLDVAARVGRVEVRDPAPLIGYENDEVVRLHDRLLEPAPQQNPGASAQPPAVPVAAEHLQRVPPVPFAAPFGEPDLRHAPDATGRPRSGHLTFAVPTAPGPPRTGTAPRRRPGTGSGALPAAAVPRRDRPTPPRRRRRTASTTLRRAAPGSRPAGVRTRPVAGRCGRARAAARRRGSGRRPRSRSDRRCRRAAPGSTATPPPRRPSASSARGAARARAARPRTPGRSSARRSSPRRPVPAAASAAGRGSAPQRRTSAPLPDSRDHRNSWRSGWHRRRPRRSGTVARYGSPPNATRRAATPGHRRAARPPSRNHLSSTRHACRSVSRERGPDRPARDGSPAHLH